MASRIPAQNIVSRLEELNDLLHWEAEANNATILWNHGGLDKEGIVITAQAFPGRPTGCRSHRRERFWLLYMNIQMLKADVRAMFKVAKPMVRSVGPSPMILAFALALLSLG